MLTLTFLLATFVTRPALADVEKILLERAWFHAHAIATRFPAADYFILNLGKTTPAISSMFRKLVPDHFLRHLWFKEIGVERLERIAELSEADVFQMFDNILPTDKVLHGRTIIITRALWQTRTMAKLLPLLARYVSQRRPSLAVGCYFIIDTDIGVQPLGKVLESLGGQVGPVEVAIDLKYTGLTVDSVTGTSTQHYTEQLPFSPSEAAEPRFRPRQNYEYSDLDQESEDFLAQSAPDERKAFSDTATSLKIALEQLQLCMVAQAVPCPRPAPPPASAMSCLSSASQAMRSLARKILGR